MIVNKKIVWITPDCFVDCDFNVEVLSEILKEYSIHWVIILPSDGSRFHESDFERLSYLQGITIEFLYTKYRARDPRMLLFFETLYRRIRKVKGDLVYFNYVPATPYILPLYWRLNIRKTIFTAHDGGVNKAFKFSLLSKVVFKLAFSFPRNINMFSASQAKLFERNFGKKNIFVIPLSLKDFGSSTLGKNTKIIQFGFFGTVHYGKNLRLLIDAACELFDEGITQFKVLINGNCSEWDSYEERIRYPELFDVNIRHIDNSEIPDIFARCHYMVFPYRVMSQSGALKVAFNYNTPVVVSDLDGFKDEVKTGINGYIFRSEDVEDLKLTMKFCIQNFIGEYNNLYLTMKEHTQSNYSNSAISEKYLQMFGKVLQK